MARLNESTASAESIEILKRRFVRQNREIARVNSIQSLRIRSLESEVSHLLSENVSLREEVIMLSQELERLEAAKALHDGVYDMKARLDSKLVELSSLVAELGTLPRQFSRSCREKADQNQSRWSSDNARQKAPNVESISGHEEEGRLPVILEDKYYPRTTSELHELERLSAGRDILESPGTKDMTTSSSSELEDQEEMPREPPHNDRDILAMCDNVADEISLPPTLETRKKKKIDNGLENEVQSKMNSEPPLNSRQAPKCGAKRKFSAEDEDICGPAPIEDDGFEFSRPAHLPAKLSAQIDHSPIKRKIQMSPGTISQAPPKWKVLEPKSTNLNVSFPNNPHATKDGGQYENKNTLTANENMDLYSTKFEKDLSAKRKLSPKKSISKLARPKSEGHRSGESVTESIHFNPSPSALSPPGHPRQEEAGALEGVSNAPSRPSRRRGAVVSYAEPNLRDKMRRPTNEFVAAVGGDMSKIPGSQTTQAEVSRDGSERNSGSVGLRKSQGSDTPDREPLTEISGSKSRRQMDMISQRKRKTSSIGKSDLEVNFAEDLIGHKSRPSTVPGSRSEEETEIQGASYAQASSAASEREQLCKLPTAVAQAAQSTNRQSRRHSSITKSSGHYLTSRFDTTIPNDIQFNPSTEASRSISIPKTSTQPTRATDGSAMEFQDHTDHVDLLVDAKQIRRGQRAAARRRSMML